MLNRLFLLLGLTLVLPLFGTAQASEELYRDMCTRCHNIDGYVWDRSFKAWEACVYTMQSYSGDEDFTDETADRIIDFLVANGAELEKTEAAAAFVPLDVESATPAPTHPSSAARALRGSIAKGCGYAAVIAMLFSLESGIRRRKHRKKFRPIHRSAAGVLVLALLVHSAYYLATFGTPSIAWLLAGVAASGILLITVVGALFRKHYRRAFLKFHKIGAVIGLTATLLHWVLIYI